MRATARAPHWPRPPSLRRVRQAANCAPVWPCRLAVAPAAERGQGERRRARRQQDFTSKVERCGLRRSCPLKRMYERVFSMKGGRGGSIAWIPSPSKLLVAAWLQRSLLASHGLLISPAHLPLVEHYHSNVHQLVACPRLLGGVSTVLPPSIFSPTPAPLQKSLEKTGSCGWQVTRHYQRIFHTHRLSLAAALCHRHPRGHLIIVHRPRQPVIACCPSCPASWDAS